LSSPLFFSRGVVKFLSHSTPIISVALQVDDNESVARIIKGRIEKTRLGEISMYIKEVYENNNSHLTVKLDMQVISKLQLDITVDDVRHAIVRSKLRVKPDVRFNVNLI
jgi:DNA-directed RNA polymerase III subunit RPC1